MFCRPRCNPKTRANRQVRLALGLLAGLAVCLALPGRATALDPNRTLSQAFQRIWQVQQGLPQGTILNIRQTHDGYLWLGTQSGLVRFDGLRFVTITTAGAVPIENLWVQDLYEDSEHNLWIATDGGGLIRWRQDSAFRYTRADGLPSLDVRGVCVDARGRVWAGTAAGLVRIEGDRAAACSDRGAPASVQALAAAPDGMLWIATDDAQLSTWDGERFHSRAFTSRGRNESIHCLLPAADGTLWIGTSDGLVRLTSDGPDRFTEQRFSTADGLANDYVLSLAPGAGGVLWIGTRDGFSRFYHGEFESFLPRDGLSQSTAYAVCEDREGSLWVGTKHGLNQFADRRTILYTAREGLPSNDTGPVLQDTAGQIWVGTLDAGLARFDGRRFEVLAALDGRVSQSIRALASGSDNELWIGTDRGLNRLTEGHVTATYTAADGLPADEIRCLAHDQKGKLWAGTSAGVAMLEDGRFVAPRSADASALPIAAIAGRPDGSLLAAVEDQGLFVCADGEIQPWKHAGLPDRHINTIWLDTVGRIWMGTQGNGLLLINGQQACAFSTRDGLYDDEIFGIVADDQKRLWMACSKGIFYVPFEQLLDFAAGRLARVTSAPFSPMDSQRTIECQGGVQPGVWRMNDGRVWFSTIRGVIVIDPARLQRALPPMPVVIEDVVVNGKSEPPEQVRDLPPGPTNLEFRYAGLSFVAPTRTTYRYMLEGFDKQWVEAGTRREAFYTNLAPGAYRFRVLGRHFDGKKEEAAPDVAFSIQPHFYQRRWFVPACVALVALAGAAGYRLRVRGIKQQLRLVLAERSRIARELHDTLMQGFSGVTMEMQALSTRLPQSEERRTLEEIIRDAAICLREARRSVAGLRNARGDETGLSGTIAQAVRHLCETHDVRLSLRLDRAPDNLPPEVQYNLLRVVQEATTNALKHSASRTLTVTLDSTPERLRVSVLDEGVGFMNDSPAALPGHYGLIGMRERAAQIGAELSLDSQPGRGTSVIVVLPLTGAGANARLASAAESERDVNSTI